MNYGKLGVANSLNFENRVVSTGRVRFATNRATLSSFLKLPNIIYISLLFLNHLLNQYSALTKNKLSIHSNQKY